MQNCTAIRSTGFGVNQAKEVVRVVGLGFDVGVIACFAAADDVPDYQGMAKPTEKIFPRCIQRFFSTNSRSPGIN